MGYQVYSIGHDRFGGYGVPAYCEQPGCNEEIDRGMSYACGGEPFSEYGCDRYFCSEHLHYTYFDPEEDDGRCKHEYDCECETAEVCERCRDADVSFDYKPEHPEWMEHLVKDESWEKWRSENKELVKEYKKLLKNELVKSKKE